MTDEDNGTIQEASILAYLWRRTAATNNQPNEANWEQITDDNNVFDTGTINSNFSDRYKTSTGAIVQNQSAATAAGKYGENFLAIKLDCLENEEGFRMTSFTTTPPADEVEYEWALTLALIDKSTGCTAPLDSVGANAMVYVHDANYYYDGDWSNSPTPTEPPMFVFDDPIPVPIANIGYEYKTGMIEAGPDTRATPYLNSIPFHLQDNRTKLEFDSFMYKVESATVGGTQTINFTKISTYQNFENQVGGINVQNDFSKNPNMSPGMAVYKVGATNSPSDRTLVGYVNALVFINEQPATQSFYFTPISTPLAINDIIIISQDTNNFGSLWARTMFGNSIRQLYTDSLCTTKWQPPVKDRFYVMQTQTDQNMKEVVGANSLLLGEVSDYPLYCMNLNEKGRVSLVVAQDPNNKFPVQTCWDAGLFTDFPSTFVEMFSTNNAMRSYREVWATKNFDGTKFRDGTEIPERASQLAWNGNYNAAWCHVNGDHLNNLDYGKLYNWYAAVGINEELYQLPRKNLAPYGWYIPVYYEFDYLRLAVYYATGSGGNGDQKPQFWREIGTKHWLLDTTVSSNNISGFTAFGAGVRGVGDAPTNGYKFFKEQGRFWNNWDDPYTGEYAPNFLTDWFQISSDIAKVVRGSGGDRRNGYSIRLAKENMNTPGVYGRPLIQYLGAWSYDTVYNNG